MVLKVIMTVPKLAIHWYLL